jgi:5-methylcytosine-specific restriction endonuclease McrA
MECGVIFSVMRSRKHRRFCSQECYHRHKVGVQNGNWQGGHDPYYYGPDWKQRAEEARRRDGYKCQRCGKPQGRKALDVHHKRPYPSFGHRAFAEANQLSNLITLCHPCHMAIEGKELDFQAEQ